jgi:nicotinamidase-related amidase
MRPALLLIDVQANMFDPAHSVESASPLLQRIMGLLARARGEDAPIVFVRNCGNSGDPDVRGTSGWELQPPLRPQVGELILDKTTCDAFASTHLQEELAAREVTSVVIAGLQSEYCILETTLGALARNLKVTLVSDGHGTYPSADREAAEISAAVNAALAGRVTLANTEAVRFD